MRLGGNFQGGDTKDNAMRDGSQYYFQGTVCLPGCKNLLFSGSAAVLSSKCIIRLPVQACTKGPVIKVFIFYNKTVTQTTP